MTTGDAGLRWTGVERAPGVVLSGVPQTAVTHLEAGGVVGGALDGRLRHAQVGSTFGCRWVERVGAGGQAHVAV